MGKVHELRLRHNRFVNDLNSNVEIALETVNEQITDINRGQLLQSENALGEPLFNEKTKSTKLTPAYAKRTGKTTPNLYLKGDFQGDMFSDFRLPNEYYIQSEDPKQGFLMKMYKNIFGIAKKNQRIAQFITTTAIMKRYKREVYVEIS